MHQWLYQCVPLPSRDIDHVALEGDVLAALSARSCVDVRGTQQ